MVRDRTKMALISYLLHYISCTTNRLGIGISADGHRGKALAFGGSAGAAALLVRGPASCNMLNTDELAAQGASPSLPVQEPLFSIQEQAHECAWNTG